MSSGLQNKMLNYEVTPPAGVWEKIAEALDESELVNEFSSKLYGAEVIPPVSVWNKIATSLDAEHEAAIPDRRRLSPLFKYAAAAVVIGFVAWGGIRLLNNKSGKNDLAKLEIIPPEKDIATPQTNPFLDTTPENVASANNNISSDEARNDAALEASKRTFAKLDVPVNSRLKEIAASYHFNSAFVSEVLPGSIHPSVITNTTDLSGCYITLMTPEGHIIRMSNKLSDLACCVSGEVVDAECKDQMKKWREKVVSSPSSHSTGGFMDILSLVKTLQDY